MVTKKYNLVPQHEGGQADGEQLHGDSFELHSWPSVDETTNVSDLEDLEHEFDIDDTSMATSDAGATGGESEERKSNMRMAFMNMANSILGAGIIGQPYAFSNTGIVSGIIVMIGLAFLIDWTLRLIVINAILSQTRSYQDTVLHCFGIPGRIILLISISSFAYGGCMAFCVIIGDTIPHVLKAFIPTSVTSNSAFSWMFLRNFIIVLFTTCISYPLSLNRDISKLAKALGFALIGMAIIVTITIVRGAFIDPSLKQLLLSTSQIVFETSIFQGISVISFALVCHHNTIFIYNSLKRATIEKFLKLTHIACAISAVCCLTMGLCGFLYFGDKTNGNILNNFKGDDNWINVARFFFGLNMLTTFPLEIFVVRDVLKDIFFLSTKTLDPGSSTSELELNNRQHIIITTFLVFSSMAVSLFTCNLGLLLELIGSTSASLMAYIIPPMCYFKLKRQDIDYKSCSPEERRKFILYTAIPSISCIVFGFMIIFISSFMSIKKSMNDHESAHCVVN